jgi:hypothetical protein
MSPWFSWIFLSRIGDCGSFFWKTSLEEEEKLHRVFTQFLQFVSTVIVMYFHLLLLYIQNPSWRTLVIPPQEVK